MSADPGPEQSATPLSRSERLSRDVLHALVIDPQPWAEIQANRREVVRTTFEELDPQDEFEGMLASQMAVAHSIFLGTSWLSLDRERPQRDRTHYLRQATRLMMLYRQSFNTLRQWRRERTRTPAGYGPRRRLAFQRRVERPRVRIADKQGSCAAQNRMSSLRGAREHGSEGPTASANSSRILPAVEFPDDAEPPVSIDGDDRSRVCAGAVNRPYAPHPVAVALRPRHPSPHSVGRGVRRSRS